MISYVEPFISLQENATIRTWSWITSNSSSHYYWSGGIYILGECLALWASGSDPTNSHVPRTELFTLISDCCS